MEPVTHAERLAALLDGRLGERERAELMAQLAAPDEELDVLADAAAVMRELEEEDRAAGVVPLVPPSVRTRRWRSLRRSWAAVAAMVAVVAVSWTAWRAPSAMKPGGAYAMLGPDAAGTKRPEPAWAVRGARGGSLAAAPTSVRLGAAVADLEIAVGSAQHDSVAAAARRAADVLRNGPPGGIGLANRFEDFGSGAATKEDLDALALEAAGHGSRPLYTLGEWAQMGRAAARLGREAYFQTPESRRYLRARPPRDLSPAAANALAEIRSHFQTRGAPDWSAREAALTKLLRTLGQGQTGGASAAMHE